MALDINQKTFGVVHVRSIGGIGQAGFKDTFKGLVIQKGFLFRPFFRFHPGQFNESVVDDSLCKIRTESDTLQI